MEPLFAVLLPSAARLYEAVREDAEGSAGLERRVHGLVVLVCLDAERKTARRDGGDLAVGAEHPRRRMARARGAHDAGGGIDGQAGHGHERPSRKLTERHLVRLRQEVGRIRVQADERTERELGERHVGRGRDSVTARVAQHDRELPVRQREEVVDVASDLDPRRGLVDGSDLEASTSGTPRGSSERCIVSAKSFRSWVSRAFSIASAACPATKSAVSTCSSPSRRDGSSETTVSVASSSAEVAIGTTSGGRALLEERDEKLVRGAEPAGGRGIEHERLAHAEQLRPGSLSTACSRSSSGVSGAARRSSANCGACGTSWSPRSPIMRITAASASSRSTAALVTASSVASSERLWANEREISYSARSRFADLRSEAIVSWSSVA